METLEAVLKKIESSIKDLNATMIIQQEVGHWEDQMVVTSDSGLDLLKRIIGFSHSSVYSAFAASNYLVLPNIADLGAQSRKVAPVYVMTEPERTGPDLEKIGAAKNYLGQVYDSSPWYSAKYTAGKAIGRQVKKRNMTYWYAKLHEKLKSTRIIRHGKTSIEVIDIEQRVSAAKDLAELFIRSNLPIFRKQLRNEYAENSCNEVNSVVGKTSGYS